jgi:uncharacterized membrane protein YvlD (DUF360 family)
MIEEIISPSMFNHGISQLIAMLLTIFFIPRLWVTSPIGAFGILIAIAMVNATFWDTSLFFFLPDTISVNGLKLLLANGVLFWVLVHFVPGIRVQGILPAILAPLLFTLISSLLNVFAADVDWVKILSYFFDTLVYFKNSLLYKRG